MDKANNFKPILDLLKKLDFFAGNILFQKDSIGKKSWKEKLVEAYCKLTFVTFVINVQIFVISTVILSNFSIMSIILCSSATNVFIGISYNILLIKFKKGQTESFLEWCESLHDYKTKFHPAVQDLAETNLTSMTTRIVKIFTWIRKALYFDFILITVGFAIIGQFLPESIYPKYSLPSPVMYPFKNQETWLAFVVGVIGQTKVAMDAASLILLTVGIISCIVSHILTYLDIIKASIRLMKDQLELKHVMKVESIEENDRIEVIDLEGNSESIQVDASQESKPSFDEWIKLIVEMIQDVNEVVSRLTNFYSGLFLFIECASFGCFFFSGMIFLIIHQQYFVGFGVICIPLFLLALCYANEMILESLSKIKDEFNDIPWFALTTKEQKILLIAMECDNIQRGFNAAKFHTLNNERFATILHVAYSNVLVLRDLVRTKTV